MGSHILPGGMLTHRARLLPTPCSRSQLAPQSRAHPPATAGSELKGCGRKVHWLSLPGPAPKAMGTHRASGGEATSSRQREVQGQESWKKGRAGQGKRRRSPRGSGNPTGVKYHLPSDRHTLEDPGEYPVGDRYPCPEERTRTHNKAHRDTHIQRCAATRPPDMCAQLPVPRPLARPSCSCSLPVISSARSRRGHACCHLLTQTWQGPASRPSIIQEGGCQPWIGTREGGGKPAGPETLARAGPGA